MTGRPAAERGGAHNGDYPTEAVECGTCDGCGIVDYEDDVFGWEESGWCHGCAGTGTVEVCANCYDDGHGCTVCDPLGAA